MSYLGQQLGQGQAERFIFTASGGETSVTTADDGRAIAYTVGQVDVYLNGAKLINGSDFTANTGTSITGLSALTASDVVEVFALSIFQASDTVSAASGGTFNGNVTVDANLTVTGTVDLNGGNIDGTVIGAATPAAGSFTTGQFGTSLNVDGTVTADGLTVDGVSNLNGVAQVGGSTDLLYLSGKTGTHAYVSLGASNTAADFFIGADTAIPLIFRTSATERMRIDSSGNLLIGKSSLGVSTVGAQIESFGLARFVRNGGETLILNRLTSDGDILGFQKDGTVVGSIGAKSGDIYIGTGDTGIRFNDTDNSVYPADTTTGSASDGNVSLGVSSARWKDLYLSGGVYLGGTGAANLLDDYEEGTWTPALYSAGNTSATSITNESSTYTKVGNKVYCQIVATVDDTAIYTEGDYLIVSGLPFTARFMPSEMSPSVGSAISRNNPESNATRYAFYDIVVRENSSRITVTCIAPPSGSALGGYIIGSFSYTVD